MALRAGVTEAARLWLESSLPVTSCDTQAQHEGTQRVVLLKYRVPVVRDVRERGYTTEGVAQG